MTLLYVIIEDFKKGNDEVLKELILSLNPLYLPEKYYKLYKPIPYSININLIQLSKQLSSDYIKNHFNEISEEYELETTLTSKNDCYKYLELLLDDENAVEKINKMVKFSENK